MLARKDLLTYYYITDLCMIRRFFLFFCFGFVFALYVTNCAFSPRVKTACGAPKYCFACKAGKRLTGAISRRKAKSRAVKAARLVAKDQLICIFAVGAESNPSSATRYS